MIIDYESLVTAFKNYLQRTDQAFETMIPTFVQLAQNRITKDLKILSTQSVNTYTFTGNDGTPLSIPHPPMWLSTISIFTSTGKSEQMPVEIRTLQFLQQYNGITELPTFFAEESQQRTRFNRFYSPNLVVTFNYYSSIPILSGTNPTNIILTAFPQLFLYAALLESASYLREDERFDMWSKYYGFMKEAVNKEDIARIQLAKENTH